MAEFAFAFLDCEFGGLDVERHDITEVGVIVTDDRLRELDEKSWRVAARPERISPEAAKIFGYDEALWADAVPVRQALEEFTALLPQDKTVVPAGQNVRMDVQFLERAYKACELHYPFDYHVIDLAPLFYSWCLVAGEPVGALSQRVVAELLQRRFHCVDRVDGFLQRRDDSVVWCSENLSEHAADHVDLESGVTRQGLRRQVPRAAKHRQTLAVT